jgi:Nuclease-related domain
LRGGWRRRVVGRLLILVLPFLFVGGVLTAQADDWWRWSGGVVLGLGLALFVIAWQTPPRHIESWNTGADGERRTGRVLQPLTRSGWHAVHDLDWPGAGNVDHVLLGPGGVYVLDSKAWNGVVSVDDGGATITPRDNPDAAWTERGQQSRQARAGVTVARALAARSNVTVPAPVPVVVLWSPFPQRVATSGGVTYVEGNHLADWLISRPRKLHRQQIAQLGAVVSDDLLRAPATVEPSSV